MDLFASAPPYVVTCAYLERVAQDALVLLQRVKDEGKLSVFLFSRTISACTKADGSFHRMSIPINTKQLSLKLCEHVVSICFNVFNFIMHNDVG